VVATERDSIITHCVLLACSGDICDAATRLHRLNRALALVVGRFAPSDSETSRLRLARGPAASLVLRASLSSSTRAFQLTRSLGVERRRMITKTALTLSSRYQAACRLWSAQ
jgi:hypothetical protein